MVSDGINTWQESSKEVSVIFTINDKWYKKWNKVKINVSEENIEYEVRKRLNYKLPLKFVKAS